MNTSHAVFGGLALIAAAILAGQSGYLGAQDQPKPVPLSGPFELMTPFQRVGEGPQGGFVFRIDGQTGLVSVCDWNGNQAAPPVCSPWSEKDSL
jgi:hypothetical protein